MEQSDNYMVEAAQRFQAANDVSLRSVSHRVTATVGTFHSCSRRTPQHHCITLDKRHTADNTTSGHFWYPTLGSGIRFIYLWLLVTLQKEFAHIDRNSYGFGTTKLPFFDKFISYRGLIWSQILDLPAWSTNLTVLAGPHQTTDTRRRRPVSAIILHQIHLPSFNDNSRRRQRSAILTSSPRTTTN